MIRQRNFKSSSNVIADPDHSDLILGTDVDAETEIQARKELTNEFKIKALPQNLTSSDLEQLQVLKYKLKNISNDAKEGDFIKSLNEVIDFLEDDVMDNKKQIVLYVMHKLERFILKPKMGQVKKQLAIKVLSRLFYNDENLTGLFIDSLMVEHKQIKTLGRIALRIYRFFLNSK